MKLFNCKTPSFAFVLFALLFTSCANEDGAEAVFVLEVVTEQEAVEIIETYLNEDAGGISTDIDAITEEIIEMITSGTYCNVPYNAEVSDEHEYNEFQSSYFSSLDLEMSCNALNIPQNVIFNTLTKGTLTTPRISSESESGFEGVVSGLGLMDPAYVIEGTYQLEAMQQISLTLTNPKNVSVALSMDLVSLQVNKTTSMIDSGTGTIAFVGETESGMFPYEATIVFNGDNTATIDFNGHIHTIDWN